MKTREGVRLEIEFAEEDEYASLAGWRGAVRRLRLLADIQNRTAGCTMPVKDDRLAQKLAHMTRRLTLHPERAVPAPCPFVRGASACARKAFPVLFETG